MMSRFSVTCMSGICGVLVLVIYGRRLVKRWLAESGFRVGDMAAAVAKTFRIMVSKSFDLAGLASSALAKWVSSGCLWWVCQSRDSHSLFVDELIC